MEGVPRVEEIRHDETRHSTDSDLSDFVSTRNSTENDLAVPEKRKVPSIAESEEGPKEGSKSLSYKESIKARKQTYKIHKKKVVKEFSSVLKDKSVTILSSWLKIRGTLKSWAKYWCVIKPEVVVIYKSNKHHHWVGTILLNHCEFIERPSSKDGFCFKIFQPYRQSI